MASATKSTRSVDENRVSRHTHVHTDRPACAGGNNNCLQRFGCSLGGHATMYGCSRYQGNPGQAFI